MSAILTLTFAPDQKEIVLGTLYDLELNSFQEGGYGISDSGTIPNENTCITCYFASADEALAISRALGTQLPGVETSLSSLEDLEWQERWKEYLKPIEISERLLVKASCHEISARPGQQVLTIDPQLAFGTGGHPTTKLCLTLIDQLFRDISSAPQTVLDVGCGSGILAIAADMLGATAVLGVDIEPLAIEVSAANAVLNNALCCQFSAQPLSAVPGTFDLVLANILSSTLHQLMPEILSRCAPAGTVVLSGVLETELDDFVAALPLRPASILVEDSWLALVLHP